MNFYGGGGEGFQQSPPAGSDFALRATQGQSRLLKAHTSSPKTLCARRERPAWDAGRKVVFRSPYSLSKKLYAGKGKGYAGPKSAFYHCAPPFA